MTDKPIFEKGEQVQHKTRKLHDASFVGWSKSGKRIGVNHNFVWPYGVGYKTDYFDPKNIVRDSI
ncbi:hypothetical protein ACFQ5D_10805 [Paenibacillus farraposensis]|uniref:Uncharacterized protein n=1 Tax=Paenibacillus farraposensis TaxID=2807095 RepID=A0ABW4DFC5_9BACL|nr:hypothetical protein [Paenibacillus farraposensis]MCC3380711.1 hypothetical protein [Paenibacillus farraposensis]